MRHPDVLGHRRWSDFTLLPNVQPREPSQLIDHVIRPFNAPEYAFHAWATTLVDMWPPPAPG